MDCHFVSKFLTKPWEHENRELYYYDFSLDNIYHDSYRKVFSRPNTNTEKEEAFFNKYIERPLSNIHDIVFNKKYFSNWKVYRAIYLLGLLQAPRFFKGTGKFDSDLDTLFIDSEKYIDEVVRSYDKTFFICGIELPASDQLFFPEIGLFFLPIKLISSSVFFKFAYCIPLTPKKLIVIMPRDLNKFYIDELLASPELIMGFSIGISEYSNKVVIPKEFLKLFSEAHIIKAIKHWRQESEKMIRFSYSINNALESIYASFGVKI